MKKQSGSSPDGRRWAAQARRLFPLLVRFQTWRYAMTQQFFSSDCFMKTIWFVFLLSVAAAVEMQAQVVPRMSANAPGSQSSLSVSNATQHLTVERWSNP